MLDCLACGFRHFLRGFTRLGGDLLRGFDLAPAGPSIIVRAQGVDSWSDPESN